MHSPLAAVLKAAPTLVDEHYADIMPVAWELLLEVDKEVSACAGTKHINLLQYFTLFITSSWISILNSPSCV